MQFAPDANSARQRVQASREVIVAAGSLHSAQLMQLSGIGPAALLEEFNITVAIDLPGVGNNLQDHCLVGTFYPCRSLHRTCLFDIDCVRQQSKLSKSSRLINQCFIQC